MPKKGLNTPLVADYRRGVRSVPTSLQDGELFGAVITDALEKRGGALPTEDCGVFDGEVGGAGRFALVEGHHPPLPPSRAACTHVLASS